MMRLAAALALFTGLCLPFPALADAPGQYRLAEGPDAAGGLLLREDGTYSYFLIVGALDEESGGTWARQGDAIVLTTEPKPVLPIFQRTVPGSPEGEAEEVAFLLVTWPDGRGIAGVDFVIGCADGAVMEGYTQSYGWTPSADKCAEPQWIELSDPFHQVRSPRFQIGPGEPPLRFTLVPNDMGTVDLTGATVTFADEAVILHRAEGDMRFLPLDE